MENKEILQSINQLTNEITILKDMIVASKNKPQSMSYKSDNLNELFAALAKAQAEMRVAGLSSENPYFKTRYADLAEIVRASRPALTKHGLSVIQQIITHEDGQTILHTILSHSSGQWIESRMRIVPTKNDIQSLGSYITYAKRYAYASLVGVVSSDEDDDGEIAVSDIRNANIKGTGINTKYNPKESSHETVTKEQLEELEYELQEYPDIATQVLEGLKIHSLIDMPKDKYSVSIRRIREIKNARNGIK